MVSPSLLPPRRKFGWSQHLRQLRHKRSFSAVEYDFDPSKEMANRAKPPSMVFR
jgi:hypothetical protein